MNSIPRLPSKRAVFASLCLALGAPLSAFATDQVGVSPQYDTTHVYVAPDKVDAFAKASSPPSAAPAQSR